MSTRTFYNEHTFMFKITAECCVYICSFFFSFLAPIVKISDNNGVPYLFVMKFWGFFFFFAFLWHGGLFPILLTVFFGMFGSLATSSVHSAQ